MAAINVNSSYSMKFIIFLTFIVSVWRPLIFDLICIFGSEKNSAIKIYWLRNYKNLKSWGLKIFSKIFIHAFIEPIDIILLKSEINKNYFRCNLPFVYIKLNELFYYAKLNIPKASMQWET